MVNKIILIGNLGKDAESRKLDNGATITSLSLATTEKWLDKENNWQKETQWHKVKLWDQLGERATTLKQGDKIYLEGKIKYRKHEEKWYTEIVASFFKVLERKEKRILEAVEEEPAVADDDLPF